jgi:hypothetical protein
MIFHYGLPRQSFSEGEMDTDKRGCGIKVRKSKVDGMGIGG